MEIQWRILNMSKYKSSILNSIYNIIVDDILNQKVIGYILTKINMMINFEGILRIDIYENLKNKKLKIYK